jgi:hypothetical protein
VEGPAKSEIPPLNGLRFGVFTGEQQMIFFFQNKTPCKVATNTARKISGTLIKTLSRALNERQIGYVSIKMKPPSGTS